MYISLIVVTSLVLSAVTTPTAQPIGWYQLPEQEKQAVYALPGAVCDESIKSGNGNTITVTVTPLYAFVAYGVEVKYNGISFGRANMGGQRGPNVAEFQEVIVRNGAICIGDSSLQTLFDRIQDTANPRPNIIVEGNVPWTQVFLPLVRKQK